MDFQDYSGAYEAVLPEEPPYICRIDIVYRVSKEVSHMLSFQGWDDYGYVFNVDETGHIMKLPEEKMHWVTEGFI